MEQELKELIGIYNRRIKSIKNLIKITDNPTRKSRLAAKLSCYRVTLSELEVLQELATNKNQ